MPAFATHHEVRVTARQSVTTPFVPEELSPPSLLARELDKGLKGWTDFDRKVPDLTTDHKPAGLAERQLEEMKAGVVIRKAPGSAKVRRPRPATRRWS